MNLSVVRTKISGDAACAMLSGEKWEIARLIVKPDYLGEGEGGPMIEIFVDDFESQRLELPLHVLRRLMDTVEVLVCKIEEKYGMPLFDQQPLTKEIYPDLTVFTEEGGDD